MIINNITNIIINDCHCCRDRDYYQYYYFCIYHHPLRNDRKDAYIIIIIIIIPVGVPQW